jgi:ankyrin repeat protein
VPKELRSLDQLIIQNPCNADWDSMSGNDRVRFCEHCSLRVTNLSSLTRVEAMRLVAGSEGRLCVRFIQSPSGQVLTKAVDHAHRISRRVSRIAAGAFTATLSLSSAAAQSGSRSPLDVLKSTPAVVTAGAPRETGANLSGVIKDPNGAVVAAANVTLINTQTEVTSTFITGDDGAYKFSVVEAGRYNLTAEANGFLRAVVSEFELKVDVDRTENFVLQIPEITAEVEIKSLMTMGVVSMREPEDPLVKAASKDDVAEAARLALSGSDTNVVDKATNMTALAYATENGNIDMINVLISAGASPNAANTRGQTPLMYLRESATSELVRDLLNAGAEVNARDESGETPLMHLATSGSFELVKQLLDAGAKIDDKDDEGNTVLMSAAQNEDARFLRLLIKAGMNVDAKNHDGGTALLLAARSGNADSMKALLEAGASMNLHSKDLNQALMLALGSEEPRLAKILLDAGADANAKEDNGTTALMRAAKEGHPAVVKTLIDAGAELNPTDDDGWTALMHADEVEVVRVLLNAGADLTIKNKDGETALKMARRYEQTEVVKLLESRGAPE